MTTTALCTIAQVKARLFPAGTTDTSDDTLFTELVNECSAWIEDYTGRKLGPDNAATYIFDTAAGSVLRVSRGIRTITSMGVSTSHQPDAAGAYTTIPAADRLLRPKAADLPEGWPATEVHIGRGTLAGTVRYYGSYQNGATIAGDFGFAAVPASIESVAIDAVVAAYQSRRNGASSVMGADDMAMPPWNHFFGRGSPQRGTLDRYRWVPV